MRILVISTVLGLSAAQADPVTFNNLPLGSKDKPLILRTYLPDPGLDPKYFAHHGKGAKSPKYNVGQGKDSGGEFTPIKGLPAAIGVNHGPALSYAFDTLECRIAYAWQGGFLDMYPYWGDQGRGNRLKYNYVPHMVGILFEKADPLSKIYVGGKNMAELKNPKFQGYDLKDGQPVFFFERGGHDFVLSIRPSKTPLSYELDLTTDSQIGMTYGGPKEGTPSNTIKRTVTGKQLASYQGFPRHSKVKTATVANGQLLFDNLGCAACHSVDGSVGHGPTLAGLFNSERLIEGADKAIKADAAYLLESIKDPNAKVAKNFPPNYMPPYKLSDPEYQSLVLFIQSIEKGE